jgi:hypothetical protein
MALTAQQSLLVSGECTFPDSVYRLSTMLVLNAPVQEHTAEILDSEEHR